VRRVCSQFATGVTIATVLDETGAPQGLTVSSFTTVSLAPPLVLICIDHRSAVLRHFRQASHYGIQILSAAQRDLSTRFATRPDARFDGVEWHPGITSVPLIDESLASLECAIRQVLEMGDHTVLLAEVIAAEGGTGEPLLFFSSRYRAIT
jgi:flavin reductase (DIM6/NTAB) family NADH-FMN oxidoreductase RutF